jgi:hypothetical protein
MFLYEPQYNTMDYVSMAGPYERANLKRLGVMRAGKTIPLDPQFELKPGDTLLVPQKPRKWLIEKFDQLSSTFSMVSTIILIQKAF